LLPYHHVVLSSKEWSRQFQFRVGTVCSLAIGDPIYSSQFIYQNLNLYKLYTNYVSTVFFLNKRLVRVKFSSVIIFINITILLYYYYYYYYCNRHTVPAPQPSDAHQYIKTLDSAAVDPCDAAEPRDLQSHSTPK
jgi:hypothetical protein